MEQQSIFSIISPIMVGPSSSHTAGAIKLGLMARSIYGNSFNKVKFVLYNSFATTGLGHGTDKGVLSGLLGYGVDNSCIKNIFNIVKEVDYSYKYVQDISRYPNSVDIIIDDKMSISGDSVGAGEIRIVKINNFSVNIDGKYDSILVLYKDRPGVISKVSDIIQKHSINIATLNCDRDSKGGTASMCIELDLPASEEIINAISEIREVSFVTNIGKLQ